MANRQHSFKLIFQINPYTRVRKQTMKDFGDFIQQYYKQNTCEQPAQETLHENLNKFRKEHAGRLNELGRHFVYDPLSEYDKKIAEKALTDCKSWAEWKALEADDIRFKTTGTMTTISVEELLERYKFKIQQAYRAESWFSTQLAQCQTKLNELHAQPSTKSTKNKIKHWTERKITYEIGLVSQIEKTNRYERLIMKWLGIIQKIRISDAAREIKYERCGNGNKYGFNPNMASRETATGIFEED